MGRAKNQNSIFPEKTEISRNGTPTSSGHNFFRLCPICLKIHQSTHLDELRRLAKESAPGDANLARNGRISIRPAPPLRSGRNFRSFLGAKISAGAATSRSAATRSCANTPPSNRRCNTDAVRSPAGPRAPTGWAPPGRELAKKRGRKNGRFCKLQKCEVNFRKFDDRHFQTRLCNFLKWKVKSLGCGLQSQKFAFSFPRRAK